MKHSETAHEKHVHNSRCSDRVSMCSAAGFLSEAPRSTAPCSSRGKILHVAETLVLVPQRSRFGVRAALHPFVRVGPVVRPHLHAEFEAVQRRRAKPADRAKGMARRIL